MKVALFVVPLEGVDPVPVQPVHVQVVVPSVIGLRTTQVIDVPELKVWLPIGGLGLPWAETMVKDL